MIKIQIVEDEFLIAKLLQRELQMAGYAVCDPVGSGEEALVQAEKEKPDFVLIDIHLAGQMNGIEAATQIYQRFQTPIIFMTGYSDPQTQVKTNSLNPLAYLVKPITPDDITPIIEKALKKTNC